jgi:hypothetical protein
MHVGNVQGTLRMAFEVLSITIACDSGKGVHKVHFLSEGDTRPTKLYPGMQMCSKTTAQCSMQCYARRRGVERKEMQGRVPPPLHTEDL